jgi:hypothetical protein
MLLLNKHMDISMWHARQSQKNSHVGKMCAVQVVCCGLLVVHEGGEPAGLTLNMKTL